LGGHFKNGGDALSIEHGIFLAAEVAKSFMLSTL
jgi:hypothetical protein